MNVDGAFWRRLALAGARYGPSPWVRYSPKLFGLVFAAALPEVRDVVRRNLRVALGPRSVLKEQMDVARTFVAFAHCLAESLAGDRPESRHAIRHVDGERHLKEALARRRGVIIVTAHAGVWDAAATMLGPDLGVEVMVVMRPERDGAARGVHDAVRSRSGVTIVHVGEHPLDAVPLLGHLRRGGVLAVQLDRAAGNRSDLSVQLFGRPFAVPGGPFLLASLTGAAVVPVFCGRRGYFDYRVRVAPAVSLRRRAGVEARRAAAQRCADELQAFLREYPTQWFHFEPAKRHGATADLRAAAPLVRDAVVAGAASNQTPRPADADSV